MQTFLPYASFEDTAKCLDYKRLGKQRAEALQIHNIVSGKRTTGGWVNHPAVVMWRDYPDALALYHNTMISEWISRGYNNNMSKEDIDGDIVYPQWLGNDLLHSSHRANLLRKDLEYYSKQGWSEDSTNPYAWFDTDKQEWYLQHVGTGIREYINEL